MAQYSRIDTALAMKESGFVPVFYHSDPEVCLNVMKAAYEGGARLFEFTNRGDFAHEIFNGLVKHAIKHLPGMILGAGSIVEAATAAIYIQSGANFIVSPMLNEDIAKVCNRRKVLWSPGCASATEISKAEELGAEIVKIFPAKEIGGPAFVKNIKGPMPWSNIMPTGGVEPEYENLKQWFNAGVWCIGIGSNLFTREIIEKRNYRAITEHVAGLIRLLKKVKEELASR